MIYTALVVLATAAPPPPIEKTEVLEQVWTRQLEVGQKLLIETEKRTYRLEMVDPRSGEMLTEVSTDGKKFSPPTKVYFLGSTAGRYPEMLVTMGQLRKGKRIELGLGTLDEENRAITTSVTSIQLVQR